MADITMCKGQGCRIRNDCYRFRAIPHEYRQSYFVSPPWNPNLQGCSHFWDMRKQPAGYYLVVPLDRLKGRP